MHLRGIYAAGYGIENSRFRLIDRSDRIVHREASFPLKAVGVVFRAAGVKIMLLFSNVRLRLRSYNTN